MRSNAFGDLRFSGRDPIEVVDELRAQWADVGPMLDDADHAQAARFEDVCKRVLEAANAKRDERPERAQRADRPERSDRGERRKRRERTPTEQPSPPVVAAPSVPAAALPDEPTAPARIPFEPLPPPPIPVAAEAEPPRRKSLSTLPPMDELDTGWDLGDDDPSSTKAEAPSPPSSDEMASDGATGGDGIDEPGWD
jgi:hypothetical protein